MADMPDADDGATDNRAVNRKLIEQFWQDLYRRDFEAVGEYFTADGHYADVPAPDDGARGPTAIAARLRLGLEPLSDIVHHPRTVVAEGGVVITEHAEEWHWPTGESVTLPFVSVHEISDGQITRWWDYWDLSTLMNAAPQWWLDHIMAGAASE